jgi:cell division protein FtsB
MRTLGNVILLLLLAIFGFGFSLAHILNLARELADARQQIGDLHAEMKILRSRFQELELERDRLAIQVQELAGANAELQAQNDRLEAERLRLVSQIEALQKQLAQIESKSRALESLVAFTRERLAALLLFPILPLSFGAVYVMARRKIAIPSARSRNDRKSEQSIIQTTLTREELHLIAQHRRSRRVAKKGE